MNVERVLFCSSFLFADFMLGLQIRNMAEKVPSFKEGGALWFTDLTTADPYFILPIMSGAFTLATIEVIHPAIACYRQALLLLFADDPVVIF